MTNFLLEILSEEIPANMQKLAAENFSKIAFEILTKNNLYFNQNQLKIFITPRRLALQIQDLPDFQKITSTRKIGPKIDADKKAINGFLKSVGLENESDLEQIENNGARCFLFVSKDQEIATAKIIQNSLPQILTKAVNIWPKLMRFDVLPNQEQPKWIRPIRNILAMFGSQVIDIEFAHLKANNLTFGHFLKSSSAIELDDARHYEKTLQQNFVIVDATKRKQIILNQIAKITSEINLKTIDNPEKSSLFDEINGLCEWPTALVGKLDKKFMQLPDEVLILTLKLNQKYLCLKDENDQLADKFIFISNASGAENTNAKIIRDNEKLVHARLSDAEFFINEDLKKPLISRVADLQKVVFHQKLGSLFDKTKRLNYLTKFLSIFVPHCQISLVERATNLCKADLVTKTVAELPELQGKIGSFYAQKQDENNKIVMAIYEHYLPQGINAELPKTALGIALSIADKIDNIVGFFLADEKPTSSKDPYALRRAALGIIRIGFEHNIAFPIRILVDKSLAAYQIKLVKDLLKQDHIKFEQSKKNLVEEIIRFFVERLKFYLKENEKLRVDIVNVVIEKYLSNLEIHKNCDILYLAKKIRFLDSFITDPNNSTIFELYKRSANILAIEEKKDGKKYIGKPLPLALKNKYEKVLYRRVKQIKNDFRKLIKKGEFASAFKLLHVLEVPLKQFFDNLTINDKDDHVRINRLLILAKIRLLFDEVADLSKIEIAL
ncbi:MAG: glycine--tRNA ligase subunit beta [Rickettsiales bacterium]|nr:glycine--tRNA ligase subunit beta [Rickettsiales bacterium]